MLFKNQERRKYKRYDVEYPIVLTSKTDKSLIYNTNTINISKKSILCKLNDDIFNLFDSVIVNILVPIKKDGNFVVQELVLEGFVVRKESSISNKITEYFVAIVFKDISDDVSYKIIQAVEENM